MRQIPAEVATLLKSRSMIGANKPACEVTVDSMPAGTYDWDTANAWHRPSTTLSGSLSVAKKTNGKFICVLSDNGIFYEGECTLDDLISKDDSAEVWTAISITGNHCAVSRVDDKLYLSVTYLGVANVTEASHKLYVSPSGNGGDWEYYSTVNSLSYSDSAAKDYLNAAGCITVLSTGRWVLPGGGFRNWLGYSMMNYHIFTSDDYGQTWTDRLSMDAYLSRKDYYEQGCPKHVTVASNGDLYIASTSNEGGIIIEFYRSTDNGDTWVETLSGSIIYADFEMISNQKGGLYLLSSGINVLEIENPSTDPSTMTLVKNLGTDIYGFDNATMQVLDERLIITRHNYALGIDPIISTLPIKSINISRNKNMAGSLNLSIDNKNGEWSPDNTVHQNVLFPNSEITVKQGYGAELVQTFKGLIDRVELTTFPQEIKLSHRDMLKKALDQTITSGTSHVITYTAQTVEAIFIDLSGKAGLTTGTIETTGLTLAEKTFSWETYADCFSWLADLVGFEYGADEEGLIYFKKDAIPAADDWILTFTDGTAQAYAPIVLNSETLKTSDEVTTYIKDTDYTIDYETGVISSITIPDGQVLMSYVFASYSFKEGEDIISLGYTIDDNDLYSKVVVYGKDANDAIISAEKEYVSKDYYKVLSQKIMKIDASDADTVEKCQAIADRAEMLMRSRVREVSFAAIAVPWLQVGDLIQVVESSTTISEIYRVTDLSTSQDTNGYTMQITCYHHSA